MIRKHERKNKQAEMRQLVGLAILSAVGSAAVTGVALAVRSQVDGILSGVLLVVAVLSALYAAMWVGGAVMFVFFDQLIKDPHRASSWYRRLAWVVALVSIPVSAYLLEFDKDQWIWGTGSTVVGLIIVLFVMTGRTPKRT